MHTPRSHAQRALVLAAGLALLSAIPGSAGAQQGPRQQPQTQQQKSQQEAQPRVAVVEINQQILDKWLVLVADIVPRLSSGEELSEAKADAIFAEACTKAGFADPNQCQSIDEYMNALVAGGDEQTRRFADPAAKAREDLKALLADKSVPAKEKQEARKEIESFIATLPAKVPEAHLALLNQNAQRIFATLESIAAPPAGAPAPEQPKGKGAPAKR
jgi:hypothetical protein